MPKVYRTMKKAEDDLPVVESSNQGLGIRSDALMGATDIELDAEGMVALNGMGMSVVSELRKLPAILIPARLKNRIPKARGDDNRHCFTMGVGPFSDGRIGEGLLLKKDKPHHGCIVLSVSMQLIQFEGHLQQTRSQWMIDET